MDEKTKKDDIYWRVLNSALELEFKKGYLKWTIAELSRKSKVTRSLIYYYFGRSKIDILKAAVHIIGEDVVGISGKRGILWAKGQFESSLLEARKIFDEAPYLCTFYLTYRSKKNEIGASLTQLEKSFVGKVQAFAPKASHAEINTLFALYFGMAFSPNVGPDEIKIFSKFVSSVLGKNK